MTKVGPKDSELDGKRITVLRLKGDPSERVVADRYREVEEPNRNMEYYWTGKSVFRKVVRPTEVPDSRDHAYAHASRYHAHEGMDTEETAEVPSKKMRGGSNEQRERVRERWMRVRGMWKILEVVREP